MQVSVGHDRHTLSWVATRLGTELRIAGWTALAVLLWIACLPVAGVAVALGHRVATGAADFDENVAELAFGYVWGGLLPLIFLLPLLVALGRRRAPFRMAALGSALVLGSLLGLYLVKIAEPAVQTYLVGWSLFGLVVPRPPAPL